MPCPLDSLEHESVRELLEVATHLLADLRVCLLPRLLVPFGLFVERWLQPLLGAKRGTDRVIVPTHDPSLPPVHVRVTLPDLLLQRDHVVVSGLLRQQDGACALLPLDLLFDMEILLHLRQVQPLVHLVLFTLVLRNRFFPENPLQEMLLFSALLLRD